MFQKIITLGFIAVFFLPWAAQAEEVHLVCDGTVNTTVRKQAGEHIDPHTGMTEQEYVNVPTTEYRVRGIRFDEETGEFWYKGASKLSYKAAVDDWIPAKAVEFSDRTITAEFDPAARQNLIKVVSFGLLKPKKLVGQLDRYSGVWRMSGMALNCKKIAENKERKF